MNIKLSPSIICSDLCNLERSVAEISQLNVDMLHIDIIDGYFSPSMPLGLDVVRALRKKTDMPFDFHIMAKENDFFVDEIMDIGATQICFHYESEIHVDRLLNKIRKAGIKAGVALIPSTPVSVLEYVISQCDFVMLALINPGYAGDGAEKQVPYALKKVSDCYRFITSKGCKASIEIDGRISIKSIPDFIEAGANIFVLGTQSLFSGNSNLVNNMEEIMSAVSRGTDRKNSNEIS
jgi:ribulose-phosphate 3-epimerase